MMRVLQQMLRRRAAARRLRQARRAIARVNTQLARRQRVPNPGYDELRSWWFLGVMALAVLVLCIDVSDTWGVVLTLHAKLGSKGV